MQNYFTSIKGKNNLTQIIAKDWILKFISLVLAVILWAFVGGEDKVNKNIMIPLEIINLPRDLVISNQFKKQIEVSVSGPRSLIMEMSSRAEPRQVDLSSATPGTMVIENNASQVPAPRGITVQRVQPPTIILSLDKLIQKQFPITAKTVGRVAKGYYVQSVKTDPDVISITGPQTILSQFDELVTRDINLDGIQESSQLQVPLELDPAIVELIGETSVTVDLSVQLKTITKTLEGVKVEVDLDRKSQRIYPRVVKITVNIPTLLLAPGVDPRTFFFVTALGKNNDNTLEVQVIPDVNLELPIEVLSIVPSVVTLVEDGVKPHLEKNTKSADNDIESRIKVEKKGKVSATAPLKVLKPQKIKFKK